MKNMYFVEIDNKRIITNSFFAFNEKGEIYLLQNQKDLNEVLETQYFVYPIESLEKIYNSSSFISNWKRTELYAKKGKLANIKTIIVEV